ncbi:hypothetical protein GLOTRDRAFT_123836 [Gloeophyllum trabeum ATCC 11539]|uniref:Xylanolytic transcriptional activator regulatory domain-containing protein n=1 Tax=Gloeophyllum trabeum (strain ATCC 11539 / FP-39264 / Madison 617) TaxID=670483 RepID=S7QL98_GLOTA|nr:uncharacterized protein GLOTRDRAFT_123836 [Gloeophyllum trabeum ATCC 11539]EPQ60077.1 hypothetical protein GLOTRDRAFT_123836 [Gloeophyllum trabeum ATCC 11539]
MREHDVGGAQFILEPSGRNVVGSRYAVTVKCVGLMAVEVGRMRGLTELQIPCEACIKRGCSAICPDGSLVVDKNNRYILPSPLTNTDLTPTRPSLVLANTEELHDEIDRLRVRLLEVEQELRLAKEKEKETSRSPHRSTDSSAGSSPLTGLDAGSPPSTSSLCGQEGLTEEEEESFIDAFGSLTIGPRGETKFFGKTARSEFLIHANVRRPYFNTEFPALSKALLDASTSAPQCYRRSIACEEPVRRELLQALPPLSEACRLCEIFLEHGRYMYCPLPREEVFDEILSSVYRAGLPTLDAPDAVALLFILLAHATYADPARAPYASASDDFYILSRVALNLMPPLRETTVMWVRAFAYQAQYTELRDFEGTSMPWIDISNAFKFGQSIGLHLKSSRWKLDEQTARKRSSLFWQLFVADAWLSFSFGRPPAMDMSYLECDLPPDEEETLDASGNRQVGFHQWVVHYSLMMRTVVMPAAFAAKTPPYAAILDLDRKVREFYVPERLRPVCVQIDRATPMYVHMQRWMVLSYRENTLLHLHRGYFAQALQDSPDEPLKHKYGLSAIAAYRSAYRLIKYFDELFEEFAYPIDRLSLGWSHMLTASIVMCLFITRSRVSKITRSAMEMLDAAHSFFTRAAETSRAAAHSLDVVQRLHRLAHSTLDNLQGADAVLPCSELDRLGGKTTLTADPESPPAQPQPSPTPSQFQFLESLPGNTHPTIMRDMMAFEGAAEEVRPPQSMFDFPPVSVQPPPLPVWDFGGGFEWAQFGNGVEGAGAGGVPVAPPVPDVPEEQPLVLDSTWQSFVEQLGIEQI